MRGTRGRFPDLRFVLPISLIVWSLFILLSLIIFNGEVRL